MAKKSGRVTRKQPARRVAISAGRQRFIEDFRAWAARTDILIGGVHLSKLYADLGNDDLPPDVPVDLYRNVLRAAAIAFESLELLLNFLKTEGEVERIKARRHRGRFPRFRPPRARKAAGRPSELSAAGLELLLKILEEEKDAALRGGCKGDITFRKLLRPMARAFARRDKQLGTSAALKLQSTKDLTIAKLEALYLKKLENHLARAKRAIPKYHAEIVAM